MRCDEVTRAHGYEVRDDAVADCEIRTQGAHEEAPKFLAMQEHATPNWYGRSHKITGYSRLARSLDRREEKEDFFAALQKKTGGSLHMNIVGYIRNSYSTVTHQLSNNFSL
jgi:hypothetical protein